MRHCVNVKKITVTNEKKTKKHEKKYEKRTGKIQRKIHFI